MRTRLVRICCFAGLLGISATAQDNRGHLEGIVTDPSKAAIANAKVTLLNVKTGIPAIRQTTDIGFYRFDLVEPGSYSITVEMTGFGKFIQENITMQTRGDVTVNAVLNPGAVQESVTVTETPPALEFNSANKEMTVDSKLVNEIPRIDRNPFKLTLLSAQAVNTRGEMQPYHSWAANSVDLGGGTNLKNDLIVDGSPLVLGFKNSTPPNTDAVQEVVVSTNSVEAQSGHSAGGSISMTTKSGTNEWHGSAFYLGRYPWLNAVADRTTFSENALRQHMMGGTFSNPIIKNKLFNFFSMEYWKVGYPNSFVATLPTPLERGGDFSKTLAIDGSLRTIYDPNTSKLNPDGSVNRTPFAGNIVPQNRFDPLSASLLSSFWDPNGPGDNLTGANNFKKGYTETYNYYNFSERVDYNISDKWKVFGRVSRYNTNDIAGNPTPNNSQLYVPTGTSRGANQVVGDAVWLVNSRTVVNFHGDWKNIIDAYVSDPMEGGWSRLWPNNPWYQSYQTASTGVPIYFPALNIGNSTFGGRGFYWNQKPKGEAFSSSIAQQKGSHYIKAGFEYRRAYGLTLVTNSTNFNFGAATTANTFSNPDLTRVGSQFATFLLGSLDGSSQMVGGPAPDPHDKFYGMYIQDDWKLNSRITVTLGLRNEYETAYYDPNHLFSKGLDLSAPVPEMMATPPQMPAQALALVGSNFYKWNGLWNWTSSSSPGMWNPQRLALQPRAGIAVRLDDKTVLRAGYARYMVPTEMNQSPTPGFETVSFLQPPFFGVTGTQNTAPLLEGVPQQTISNPFPANNPLIPIVGKGYGTNVGRGGTSLLWYPQGIKKAYNDRINVSIQHQWPKEIVTSVTWFTNFGNQHYSRALNNIDPRIQQQQQNALSATVPNPFYNYLTPELFPGPLRNQPTVSLGQLLVPYPQYGSLYEIGTRGAHERYNSLEFKAQKAFSKGYNFLVSYIYIRESSEMFINDLDVWSNQLRWQDSDQPRHRFTAAATWELPVGKGRAYFSDSPHVVNALIGGWSLAGLSTFSSGQYIRFGNLIANGNPCVDNSTPSRWFNKDVFSPLPNNTYVLRTNPLQYSCLTGPKFYNLDATLFKRFNITEKFRAELKMAAYNATNRLNRAAPVTDITNSNFGTALYQGSPSATFGSQTQESGNLSGRQVELGLKIIF